MKRVLIAATLGIFGSGCAGSTASEDEVAYYGTVQPILNENCVSCHRLGGIAPFALETFAQAQPVAGAIKYATANRTMPPWGADNSGACNTYKDARWLSDAEIASLGAWADAGAPEGDPSRSVAPPPPPVGLGTVDASADMGTEYVPDASLADDLRCFVVDPGVASTSYLTAYEVVPGDKRIVHHVVLFSVDAAGETEAESLDAQAPGLGYPCIGGIGVASARWLGGWAPGEAVTRYPDGTGIRLETGRKLVMQVHYNTASGVFPDRTRIDLELAPSVVKEGLVQVLADTSLSLPPAEPLVETSLQVTVPANVTVHGVFPHMHLMGRTFRMERSAGGTSQCMADVARYDFNWQRTYMYEQPIALQSGNTVRMTCGYDTQGATQTTTWGEGTGEEMCVAILYVTAGN